MFLMNILTNAVKYNKSGAPAVDIRFVPRGKELQLRFEDNGIGIDRSEIRNIFKKFYQVGSTDDMTAKGSGLGLYMAQQIAKIHRGKLAAESKGTGKGSVFTLTLPLLGQEDKARRGNRRAKGSGMKDTVRKRILIIEDDAHIAEGLRLNLSLKGHDAAIALDGPSGLREWKEWRPDLIVLDIMLPGIDGLSILRNIRLEDERLPILILSAKSEPEYRVKGLAYGVDDYLSKPFNLDEFLLRVERLLTQGRLGRRGRSFPGEPFHGGAGVHLRRQRDRFREIHGPLPDGRGQPDGAGNQAPEALHRQPRQAAFAQGAPGDRVGIHGGHAVTDRGQFHRSVPQILRRRPPPAEILPERALRGVRLRPRSLNGRGVCRDGLSMIRYPSHLFP